jgi:23S rRNA-/tRNA-specific pseudouridylate synthase
MESLRLPVLMDTSDYLALAKPQGVLVQADSWFPRCPVLVEAIRHQAAEAKPEFARLGIGPEGLWAVHDLDPEFYGPVLFARGRDQGDALRSACGSSAFEFTFIFLSKSRRDSSQESSFECNLPLARHRLKNKILVSHTTGKKAVTQFDKIGNMGRYELWMAKTAFPRRHQILLHAFECGIPVLGDEAYAGEKPLLLSRFKRNYRSKLDAEERPLYGGPACYLSRIQFQTQVDVTCPEPPRWKGLVNQLVRLSAG